MGLARAFTKRLGRFGAEDESAKLKPARPTISMPMELISTTNQSVHKQPHISAPEIRAAQHRHVSTSSTSSASSASSLNESDENAGSSSETPAMTDASSVESYSPIEPNHLTQYFPPTKRSRPISPTASVSVAESPSPARSLLEPEPKILIEPAHSSPSLEAVATQDQALSAESSTLAPTPALPRRAPSHSKREHERLARVRSVRSSTGIMVTAPPSVRQSVVEEVAEPDQSIAPLRASSRPASASPAIVSVPASARDDPDTLAFNPFSKELMQLDEVAEEFCGYSSDSSWEQEWQEDHRVMQEKGLRVHRASEYLRDISILRNALWDDDDEEEEEQLDNVPGGVPDEHRDSNDDGDDEDEEDDEEQFHDAVSEWI